ncbi:MAG: hypothetical protein FP813_07665 [Desulfurivibrio sp.]|nr:hypothetical protein [Desulfurivibrio sp.]
MISKPSHIPRLEFIVPAEATKKYTTLLQSGIWEEISASTSVGEVLACLPGFTQQYIREHIETIFLNGLPVDDLETTINGPSPVLAISAAMPGLAGAIFRKNSFHAALRTAPSHPSPAKVQSGEKIIIRLKFFNTIASEKGTAILNNGCLLSSDSVLQFTTYRRQLFSDLLSLRCDDKPAGLDDLKSLLHTSKTVFLRIQEENADI